MSEWPRMGQRPTPWWRKTFFDEHTEDLKPWVGVVILAIALVINAWVKGPI